MKRSPLKKKSGLRRQAKQKISVIQRRLWELCKKLIRKKYGNKCYTCAAANLSGSNWHTAHLIPKAACGAYLKYDLRNLRPCCYNCNINLGGNGSMFYKLMVEREGQQYVDRLFQDKQKIIKAYDFYFQLLNQYELLARELDTS